MFNLQRGDAIGIVSPSSPITATAPVRTERAIGFLKEKGFRVVMGDLAGKKDFYRSASIKERADELNNLIRDDSIKCIMSSIGGMNSNSLLPYIDYDAFAANPKIVIGYSDFTAVLFALYSRTGISTYYGPALVPSFGEWEPFTSMTYDYFSDIFMKDILPYDFKAPPIWTDEFLDWESQDRSKKGRANDWVTLNGGVCEGRIIIGNLNTFSGIWGSPYFPEIKKGDILFIEDSLKDASIVERSFSMLKVNGVFDKIGGLILGKHEGFNDLGSGRKPSDILIEVLGSYDFPFLSEVDCCHTLPMFTVPVGAEVRLDATSKKLILLTR